MIYLAHDQIGYMFGLSQVFAVDRFTPQGASARPRRALAIFAMCSDAKALWPLRQHASGNRLAKTCQAFWSSKGHPDRLWSAMVLALKVWVRGLSRSAPSATRDNSFPGRQLSALVEK